MAEMRIKRDLVYDYVLTHGVVTNTIVVSEVFDRLHKNVLQSVRILRNTHLRAGRDISGLFIYDRWIEKNKRNRPIFVLSQQGFDYLAKCFTNKDDRWLKAYDLILTAFHRAQNIQTDSDQSKQPCWEGSRPKPTKLTVFSSRELARFVDNDWYVSSHMVADVFDKEHSHLVFKIRRLMDGLGGGENYLSFRPAMYIGAQDREHPCFMMTRETMDVLIKSMIMKNDRWHRADVRIHEMLKELEKGN